MNVVSSGGALSEKARRAFTSCSMLTPWDAFPTPICLFFYYLLLCSWKGKTCEACTGGSCTFKVGPASKSKQTSVIVRTKMLPNDRMIRGTALTTQACCVFLFCYFFRFFLGGGARKKSDGDATSPLSATGISTTIMRAFSGVGSKLIHLL